MSSSLHHHWIAFRTPRSDVTKTPTPRGHTAIGFPPVFLEQTTSPWSNRFIHPSCHHRNFISADIPSFSSMNCGRHRIADVSQFSARRANGPRVLTRRWRSCTNTFRNRFGATARRRSGNLPALMRFLFFIRVVVVVVLRSIVVKGLRKEYDEDDARARRTDDERRRRRAKRNQRVDDFEKTI